MNIVLNSATISQLCQSPPKVNSEGASNAFELPERQSNASASSTLCGGDGLLTLAAVSEKRQHQEGSNNNKDNNGDLPLPAYWKDDNWDVTIDHYSKIFLGSCEDQTITRAIQDNLRVGDKLPSPTSSGGNTRVSCIRKLHSLSNLLHSLEILHQATQLPKTLLLLPCCC